MELILQGDEHDLLSVVDGGQQLQKAGIALDIALADKGHNRIRTAHIAQHGDDPLVIYLVKGLVRVDPQAVLLLHGHHSGLEYRLPVIAGVADKNIRPSQRTLCDLQIFLQEL